MITVEGKNGIKATVLAYSISQAGIPFITFELEYPRLILAELNTHRALSRNSFSSRAVPFNKMLEQLTGKPVRFGANQGGMQDKGEDFDAEIMLPTYGAVCDGGYNNSLFVEEEMAYDNEEAWEEAKAQAVRVAKGFYEAGYHKQVYNRLLEPFQMMKTVLSATELDNFWWLRDDLMADPTLAELARVMREAMRQAKPELLKAGEWHLPYIDCAREDNGDWSYSIVHGEPGGWQGREYLSLEDAIKVSCARCAAVSYRNEGYGVEKSRELFDRLVGSEKKHASALEHCATPMQPFVVDASEEGKKRSFTNVAIFAKTWEPGITHMDRDGQLWSGNLRGWVQYRKLVPGENYDG